MRKNIDLKRDYTLIGQHGRLVKSITSDSRILLDMPKQEKIGKLQRRKRVGFQLVLSPETERSLAYASNESDAKGEVKAAKVETTTLPEYQVWLQTQKSAQALKK
jgi:hypothetical protein